MTTTTCLKVSCSWNIPVTPGMAEDPTVIPWIFVFPVVGLFAELQPAKSRLKAPASASKFFRIPDYLLEKIEQRRHSGNAAATLGKPVVSRRLLFRRRLTRKK